MTSNTLVDQQDSPPTDAVATVEVRV